MDETREGADSGVENVSAETGLPADVDGKVGRHPGLGVVAFGEHDSTGPGLTDAYLAFPRWSFRVGVVLLRTSVHRANLG